MPVGKLCVSAVRIGWRVSVTAANGAGAEGEPALRAVTLTPRMADELSWNAMIELPLHFGDFRVDLTSWKRDCGFATPSISMTPLKNQWRECSELDWPMSKHSTSVGSRPRLSTKSFV